MPDITSVDVSNFPGAIPGLDAAVTIPEQGERLKNEACLAPIEEVLFLGSSVDVQWKGEVGSSRTHIGRLEILDLLQRAYPNGMVGDPVAIAQLQQLFVPKSLSMVGEASRLDHTRDQRKRATSLRVFQNPAGMLDYDPRERYELSKAEINTALLLPGVKRNNEVRNKWSVTMVKSLNGVGVDILDATMRQRAQNFMRNLGISPELKPWFDMARVPGKPLERRIVFTPFEKPRVQ